MLVLYATITSAFHTAYTQSLLLMLSLLIVLSVESTFQIMFAIRILVSRQHSLLQGRRWNCTARI